MLTSQGGGSGVSFAAGNRVGGTLTYSSRGWEIFSLIQKKLQRTPKNIFTETLILRERFPMGSETLLELPFKYDG